MKPEKEKEVTLLEAGYREGTKLIAQHPKSTKRIMCGIPMTGLLRSEFVLARYGQVIPCNWSQTDALQWLDQYSPLDFMVADARNIVATQFVELGYEWLFFIDHDVILPPFTVLKMNERMIKGDVPIWSGLYFTKSVPSEPLIYRGRGNGYFKDWKMGEEVWVDGLPMGCTMIHRSIMEVLYEDSEEYQLPTGKYRKVFETPAKVWYAPEERKWYTMTGTEDLALCSRIMDNKVFERAGWKEYEGKEFPFLIDTTIYCKHIDFDGKQYPSMGEELPFLPKEGDNE